jgi:hypothetical protein
MGVGEGSVNARWVGQPIRSMGDGRYGVLSENMGATRSKITPAYHDSPDRCLQGNVTSEPTPTSPLPPAIVPVQDGFLSSGMERTYMGCCGCPVVSAQCQ